MRRNGQSPGRGFRNPFARVALEFTNKLLAEAKVRVSPGIGFGEYGDGYVRFALIENQTRIRQAVRGVKDMLHRDGVVTAVAA